jgi:non-ribosomal peptide synthetase component F
MMHSVDTTSIPGESLAALFEQQVRRTPEAAAVLSDEGVLTYAALNLRANQVAHALAARGVGPEVRVGLRMRRGPGAVVAVLGVLKAGGAYVPVDPDYPEERRRFIVEDSGMALMLVDRRGQDDAEAPGVPILALDDEGFAGSLDQNLTRTDGPERADRLLYILYTSGSTGVPKGVCATHGATIHRFAWMWRTYPFQAGEVQAHRTTLELRRLRVGDARSAARRGPARGDLAAGRRRSGAPPGGLPGRRGHPDHGGPLPAARRPERLPAAVREPAIRAAVGLERRATHETSL